MDSDPDPDPDPNSVRHGNDCMIPAPGVDPVPIQILVPNLVPILTWQLVGCNYSN